ncbi:MAG: tyrosine-type recombinase/integrase [Rhodospirillaceae bacterium]|jgi:integrase|nr:tyrosine-type recombinase/integrase [Rhodospirillaceae bacterium]MBT4750924.1 tyrosine-type recombinase/integrase [Rhodospirillaceae bacterium]MBT5178162.1 tyrosine-type recombinase/integrase [Rhodospirillaceae bacterium]MBT7232246.1 tyrosine-type recombinase/integrase [Rhodospirillaceae bacterium]MBT7571976.1 tyrosine-type recombinase/integrase [Rhodospirillaceae bacterium]
MPEEPLEKKKRDHLPNKLPSTRLQNLEDGWHADGGNLYLFVRDTSRSWVFRYTSPKNKKRRNMGLGSLEAVSLARARELARGYRAMIKDPQNPIDPLVQADDIRAKAQAERAKQKTFSECAEAYLDLNRSTWANKKHAQQWENTLKTYAYPHFGDVRISEVETGHISSCLLPIWKTKTETATRLRGRIEKILDWAKVSGYRNGNNPALWKGHLDKILPKPSKVSKVVHHPALPYEKVGTFVEGLRSRNGTAARALEFTILTAARSGEVRGATWDEIDLNKKLWVIPAERMKMGRKHEVPLPDAAISILRALPRTDSLYIFPGAKVSAPMSDMTLSKVIRRMGLTDITVHGFRSSFRDWAAETTAYPREVCEMALAHAIESETEAAYRRGNLLIKRVRLMADWSKYCEMAQPSAS